MQRLAQDWLVLQLTGSPAAVGVAVALQFLPMLVVGPLSGMLVDSLPETPHPPGLPGGHRAPRPGPRRPRAGGGITVWAVYACCVALGITSAIDGPARQVFVNEVVGDAALRPAIGLNSAIGQLGAMLGPAVGGVLIAQVGSAAAFAANALVCLLVLGMIAAIRPALSCIPARRPLRGRGQVLAGFRYVRDRPSLLLVMLLAGLLGAFGMNGPVVLAAFAERVWHSGAAGFGLFNTCQRRGCAGRRAVGGAAADPGPQGDRGERRALRADPAGRRPDAHAGSVRGHAGGGGPDDAALPDQCGHRRPAGGRRRKSAAGCMALYLPLLLGGHALGGLLAGWLTEEFGVRTGLVVTGALGMLSAAVIGLLLWRNARRRAAAS